MNKIGLFYGKDTKKTSSIALAIRKEFGEDQIDIIPVEDATKKDFESYNYIIAGLSTWFDGELPSYWDEVLPEIFATDMDKKKVAIFGLGNQKGYPDNFADGIGILANVFLLRGATLVGLTSPNGYTFNQSQALCNGKFQGLVIDTENQSEQTSERISKWVKQLKKEFKENKTGTDNSFIC